MTKRGAGEADATPSVEITPARQGVPSQRRTSRTMPEAWVYLLRCRDGSLYMAKLALLTSAEAPA
jgi:hypothetical protein